MTTGSPQARDSSPSTFLPLPRSSGWASPDSERRSVVALSDSPYTGDELVLLTAVGVGALAGGTALVLAGRRRTVTA